MQRCKELENDLGFLLKQISEAIKKKINAMLSRYDLTAQQSRVLFFIAHQEGQRTTQRDIEKYMRVTHPTVVGVIRRLEEKGFVTTAQGVRDKRLTVVELTEQSLRMFGALDKGHIDMEHQMYRGFSVEEREELFRLLRKVMENVRSDETMMC